MIDAAALHGQILILLSNQVGQYTFPKNGILVAEKAPAIATLPDSTYGYKYPPPGSKCDGIEVVINLPFPQIRSYLNNATLKTYRWTIELKQWVSTGNLLLATETLINGLDYNTTSPIHTPPIDAQGILEQVKFEIVEYEYQG